jgi:predicted molibdopterin-dependent oxidoreductase YjgC
MPDGSRLPSSRGSEVTIHFDGAPVSCAEGETIATALIAGRVQRFATAVDGTARFPLCNMGTCFECLVEVDGAAATRSCLANVEDGQDVRSINDGPHD